MRGPVGFALLVVAIAAVLLCNRPADSDVPIGVAGPAVRLEAVEGLRIEPNGELPGWSAARAVPAQDSVLTVGGAVDVFELEDVTVDLGPGLRLVAERGRVATTVLELTRVEVFTDRDSEPALITADASIGNSRIEMPHLVVLDPRGAAPRNRRDLRLSFAELRQLLR